MSLKSILGVPTFILQHCLRSYKLSCDSLVTSRNSSAGFLKDGGHLLSSVDMIREQTETLGGGAVQADRHFPGGITSCISLTVLLLL